MHVNNHTANTSASYEYHFVPSEVEIPEPEDSNESDASYTPQLDTDADKLFQTTREEWASTLGRDDVQALEFNSATLCFCV